MLVEIKGIEEKIKKYNENIYELDKLHPKDNFLDFKIKNIEDVFLPYQDLLNNGGWDDKIIIAKEDMTKSFAGVYICGLNTHYELEILTNYKETNNRENPLHWNDYGVCDNATQVLNYFEELSNNEELKDYIATHNYVILLTPFFKEFQEEGGWRWHKWGKYIGVFDSKHEYLADEIGIDYIYTFDIVEVEKCIVEKVCNHENLVFAHNGKHDDKNILRKCGVVRCSDCEKVLFQSEPNEVEKAHAFIDGMKENIKTLYDLTPDGVNEMFGLKD